MSALAKLLKIGIDGRNATCVPGNLGEYVFYSELCRVAAARLIAGRY